MFKTRLTRMVSMLLALTMLLASVCAEEPAFLEVELPDSAADPAISAPREIDITDDPVIVVTGNRYAYLGMDGRVCLYDANAVENEIIETDILADEFICQEDGFAYFASEDDDHVRSLIRVDLTLRENPEVAADDLTHDLVYDETTGSIWYISAREKSLLKKYTLKTDILAEIAKLPSAYDVTLVHGLKGLYMELRKDGSYPSLYAFDEEMLKLKSVDVPAEGTYTAYEYCEVVSGDDAFYVRSIDKNTYRKIEDTAPLAMREYDGILYYVYQEEDGMIIVNAWNPSLDEKECVWSGSVARLFRAAMAIVGDRICMIDIKGRLYCASLSDGEMYWTDELAGKAMAYVTLTAVGDRLAVYGSDNEKVIPDLITVGDVSANSSYKFEKIKRSVTPTPVPTATPTVKPTLKPTEAPKYRDIEPGAKGDDVKRLQQRLNDLGYNVGKADGISGGKTQEMIRYFRSDVGLKDSKTASAEMQVRLFASDAPEFVQYKTLRKGTTGIRVEKLQERLRDRGYTNEKVDGSYGARTMTAVKTFQGQVGLDADGVAGSRTLNAIFSKDAYYYNGYVELRKGDEGDKVKQMESQLVKLGYMSKADTKFDKNTESAVKSFQKKAGLEANGIASVKTIKAMFNNPTPDPTPTPKPVTRPTLKEARKALRKTLNNKYGSDAFNDSKALNWLQQMMAASGYIFSFKNEYAEFHTDWIADYQKSRGIKPTDGKYGMMNKKTLEKLVSEFGYDG